MQPEDIRVSIRVSEDEKELIRSVASDYRLTITDFVLWAATYIRDTKPKMIVSPKVSAPGAS